jgi:hypothetical protein
MEEGKGEAEMSLNGRATGSHSGNFLLVEIDNRGETRNHNNWDWDSSESMANNNNKSSSGLNPGIHSQGKSRPQNVKIQILPEFSSKFI